MSITNRKAGDLFTTFLFQGECFQERRSNVVCSVPFLTGMALVVMLGLMFALSTPVFAFGGGGGGESTPAPKVTELDDIVAKPKDEVAKSKSPVVDPEPKNRITAKPGEKSAGLPDSNDESAETSGDTDAPGDKTAGVGDPVAEAEDEPEETDKIGDETAEVGVPGDEPDTGSEDRTAGTDDPATETKDETVDTATPRLDGCIPRSEASEEPGKEIFTVNGCVVDFDKVVSPPMIDEIIVSMGEPEYEVAPSGVTVALATGQKKRCITIVSNFKYVCLPNGGQVIHPPVVASVVNGEHSVDVRIGNSSFNPGQVVVEDATFITASGTASGGGIGVDVPWNTGNHVYLTNNADIDDMDYGIKSVHDGDRELTIINNGRILGAREGGIHVVHTNERDLRIHVANNRDDEFGSEIVSSGDGIYARVLARHGGGGNWVTVHVAEGTRVVSEESNAVAIEQLLVTDERISQHINVLIQGEVRGGETGVTITERGRSYVDILVGPEAEVYGGVNGIRTDTGGRLAIDVAGKVSGAEGVAIDMSDSRSRKLILRTGYELDGTVVSGGGTLKLDYPVVSGTFDASIVDLEKFHGFGAFHSRGHWIATGRMSEDEAFRYAYVSGTLRFSDVDFRMSGDGRQDGWDYFENGFGILQIAGSNHLRGFFKNRGRIVFVRGSEDYSPADASLTVTGDYHQLSSKDMIFNVDFTKEKANKLTIFGDVIKDKWQPQSQHVSMRVLDESKLAEESPVLIEVHEYAQTDSFEGEEIIGAFRYVLEHEAVGEVAPVPFGRNGREWEKYLRDREDEIDDMEDEIGALWREYYRSTRREREAIHEIIREKEEVLNNIPDAREDFAGYHTWRFVKDGLSDAAKKTSEIADELSDEIETPPTNNPDKKPKLGLWGEQNGSRATIGLDAFATRLMGGDMVVGTNVSQNFSTSNNIDVESHVTTLTANWERKGFYVGGQTRYASFTSDVSTDRLSVVQDNEGTGVNASVDLGYRFALPLGGMDFEVAPQAQLIWSRVNFEDFVGPHGELVSLEDGDRTTGRLGLSWEGEWQGTGGFGQFYGGMNLRSAVDGKTSVSVSGVSVVNKQDDLSVDGKLGVSYEWENGYVVHGEVSALRNDDAGEVRADLGVRIDF